jgi:hypothetical protein
MSTSNSTTHDHLGIVDIADGHMGAAQAKWSRLTEDDISSIRAKQGPDREDRRAYSLPHWVAVQDVELWSQATFRG